MKLMASSPRITIPDNEKIMEDFINESFAHGINHVKTVASYIFKNDNWSKWKVSYFCYMIKYTSIMKLGTASDKARAEASKSNYSNKKRRRS